MPEAFDNCKKRGGKIRTIKGPRQSSPFLNTNQYVHICTIDGKTHLGHVKTKKHK